MHICCKFLHLQYWIVHAPYLSKMKCVWESLHTWQICLYAIHLAHFSNKNGKIENEFTLQKCQYAILNLRQIPCQHIGMESQYTQLAKNHVAFSKHENWNIQFETMMNQFLKYGSMIHCNKSIFSFDNGTYVHRNDWKFQKPESIWCGSLHVCTFSSVSGLDNESKCPFCFLITQFFPYKCLKGVCKGKNCGTHFCLIHAAIYTKHAVART